jgi:hypothetical protein
MATLGTQKKWLLFKGDCYSQFIPINLLSVLENCGLSWLLKTGGRCSEVVFKTGLPVL